MKARKGFFITGTGTDVGKTVVSAWLALHLGADYWKPVQSGLEGLTDTQTVSYLTNLTSDHFHPSTYELIDPLAPLEAASRMGITIDPNRFALPSSPRPLIVEGAGGLMVPLTEKFLVIDLIQKLGLPAVLVSSSKLGTINHTLLSLEAMRARNIPIAGVVMSGPLTAHNREAIENLGKVQILAEIPHIDNVTIDALRAIKPHVPFSLWGDNGIVEQKNTVAA